MHFYSSELHTGTYGTALRPTGRLNNGDKRTHNIKMDGRSVSPLGLRGRKSHDVSIMYVHNRPQKFCFEPGRVSRRCNALSTRRG